MSFFKISSFLLLVSFQFVASELTMEEMRQIVAPVKIMCMEKTNAGEEQVNDISKGKLANNRELKCYLSCFLEMVQTVKDNLKKIKVIF